MSSVFLQVDENSPADSANLKTGDKIIEVNGVNVESENHAEVVQRIKTVTGETKLLVIEPAIYELYKKRGVTIRGDGDNISRYTTADSKAAAAAAKSAASKYCYHGDSNVISYTIVKTFSFSSSHWSDYAISRPIVEHGVDFNITY